MTQPTQKAQKIRVNIPRPPVLLNNYKASGDANNGKTQHQRSKSKNKIPKNLRYDLENALVGLCDVWFEEIKPYLVSNNIKLHVNASGGGAGGDRERLPPGAPGCSHLDPASTAPDCGLCRLLFNAANSIESAISQAASIAPCNPITFPTGSTAKPNNTGRNNEIATKPRRRRKQASTSERPQLFIQRLNTQQNNVTNTNPKIENQPQKQSPRRNTMVPVSKRKPIMKDKSTQTGKFVKKARTVPPTRHIARLDLRPATTNFSQLQQNHKNENPPLFRKELINIIAEKHDKYLRVLYRSPTRIESSIMSLFTPSKHVKVNASSKDLPPWK